jgi:dihydrodipicolinate synthase/N-acetylneuraminate lyase
MGLRHGPVRPPLDDMEAEERRELRQEIEAAQHPDVRDDLRERGETE